MGAVIDRAPDLPAPRSAFERGARYEGGWNVAARLAGAAGSLALVPLAGVALPARELGVWLVLSTLAGVLAFSDLGIANAAVSDLAAAAARGATAKFRSVVSTATALLIAAGLAVVALGLVLPALVHLDRLLGVPATVPTVGPAVSVYLLVLGASLPLSASMRILAALQRSDIGARIAIGAAVAQVVLGATAAAAGARLPVFTALALFPVAGGGLVAWMVVARQWPAVRPRVTAVDRFEVRRLSGRAVAYLTVGVAAAVGFETDALVIAHELGSGAAASYVLPAKLFAMIPAVAAVYFLPLWPAVARERLAGDGVSMQAWFRQVVVGACGFAASAALLVALVAGPVTVLLAPTTDRPRLALLLTLGVLAVVLSVSMPVAMFLSGLGLVRVQAVSAVAMAGANVALSIWLVRVLGSVGPPLATLAAQTVLTLLPSIVLVHYRLARADRPAEHRPEPLVVESVEHHVPHRSSLAGAHIDQSLVGDQR